jgi:hypothetical protein
MAVTESPQATRHPVTSIGVALTTLSAALFLLLWGLHTTGYAENPYLGLYAFVAIPLVFIIGLLLVPVGIVLGRRRLSRGLPISPWPRIDLNSPRILRLGLAVAVLTLVNLVIVGVAGYEAVHWMDSPRFCGQMCHTPMEPHFVQWSGASHARVPCVSCHVGSGAVSFANAKREGARQLWTVMTGTYARPIPTPVSNMRPARQTCEQCHWPDKFTGDRIRVIHEFADDAESTESRTTLRLRVGSGGERSGVPTGIHWHMYAGHRVEYIATDESRETLPVVVLTLPDGTVKQYVADGVDPKTVQGQRRQMDCIDCHNRASHPFTASPEQAVDGALTYGRIDRRLPFVRREAVLALKAGGQTKDEAIASIGRHLQGFYRANHPAVLAERKAELDRSVAAVQELYRRFVFPSMNVTWGTFPNQAGHTTSTGCFRCHDDTHKAADGSVIRQDCELCHEQLEGTP